MKILVADDDPTCRHSLEAILATNQYAVTSVGEGISVWDQLVAPAEKRFSKSFHGRS
jgi:DNA-binding response OmpR family regulator